MPFTPHERALLLVAPRIGPTVVERLEQAGLDSFAKLQAVGVDAAVERVCSRVQSRAWANRRSALMQVLAAATVTLCGAAAQASPKIATEAGCVACHMADRKLVGPSYRDIAVKYQGRPDAVTYLSTRVREGGPGNWGPIPMTPNDVSRLNDAKLKAVISWILKTPH